MIFANLWWDYRVSPACCCRSLLLISNNVYSPSFVYFVPPVGWSLLDFICIFFFFSVKSSTVISVALLCFVWYFSFSLIICLDLGSKKMLIYLFRGNVFIVLHLFMLRKQYAKDLVACHECYIDKLIFYLNLTVDVGIWFYMLLNSFTILFSKLR